MVPYYLPINTIGEFTASENLLEAGSAILGTIGLAFFELDEVRTRQLELGYGRLTLWKNKRS